MGRSLVVMQEVFKALALVVCCECAVVCCVRLCLCLNFIFLFYCTHLTCFLLCIFVFVFAFCIFVYVPCVVHACVLLDRALCLRVA